MKTIRNFSLFALTLSLALALHAEPTVYWAVAETAAANADTAGNQTGLYVGYYCTVAKAQELFGGQSVDYVTDYLAGNYAEGLAALRDSAGSGAAVEIVSQAKAAQMTAISYDHGQYVFEAKYGASLASFGSAYLAMLFYDGGGDREIRVMANNPAGYDMANGNVLFSDDPRAGGGAFGAWTAATVPEPTSGMLLLLGVAGLALRREQRS